MLNRIPPQNLDAEKAVIGSCLLSHDIAITALSMLEPQDFYKHAHAEIFQSITETFNKGIRVDTLSLMTLMKGKNTLDECGGPAYLSSLSDIIPMKSRINGLCEMVKEKAKARRLIKISEGISTQCYENKPVSEVLNEYGHEIMKISADDTKNMQTADVITKSVIKRIQGIHNGEQDYFGIPSGFPGFDRLTGGLQKAELTIIAGRPSMGKTTIAMNIAKNVASRSIPVLIFSLEMTGERLIQKTISQVSGIDTKAMDRGYLNDLTWPEINIAADKVRRLPLIIDDSSALNIQKIQARAKMAAMKSKIGLVVVDYLQLAKGRSINRQEEITEISGGLKALAKDLNIPVVALSQLSRKCEERTNKRPVMSDLRESGAIEQDAAVICFVYRDTVYNPSPDNPLRNTTELLIPKNRYGEPGNLEMGFDGSRCMFYDIARDNNEG